MQKNKEATKALIEWRRIHQINPATHGALSKEHAQAFLAWAKENNKINFSDDPKIERLYQNYVETDQIINRIIDSQEKIKKQNDVIARERKRHQETTDAEPKIIIDEEYANEDAYIKEIEENSASSKYEINSRTLTNILKNKKVEQAYEEWSEQQIDNENPKRLNPEKRTREFINWAMENTDVDFSKLLKEKKSEKKAFTSVDSVIIKIKTDKNLQPLLQEWRSLDPKNQFSTAENVSNFINWVQKEKALDIPGKTYQKLDTLHYTLEHEESAPEMKQADEEATIIVDPKVYEEAEEIEAAKRRIADLPTESDILGTQGVADKLRNHRQKMQEVYGILLDEEGNPVTPKDEARVTKMLGIIDPDVQKIQRSGFLGKIKGFFQDITTSEKDKMKAYGFKKDLSEYTHSVLENTTPKYGDRMPVGRSIIRESGTTRTQTGSIDSSRHTPIRRVTPKKPSKPRKVTKK